MKRKYSKEIIATFTGYVEKIEKIQSLFTRHDNFVITLKWIFSSDGHISKDHLRIDIPKNPELVVGDRVEFVAKYSISNEGKDVCISSPCKLRRIE